MNMNVPFSWLLAALAALMLAGCASSPETGVSSRYALAQDRAPAGNFDVSSLSDAQPRYEEPRQAGNKSPYTVWGKTYRVLASNGKPGGFSAPGGTVTKVKMLAMEGVNVGTPAGQMSFGF